VRYVCAGVDRGDHHLQVMRQPQIVVAEVRDDRAARLHEALVVGFGLVAVVHRQVDPPHTRIGDGGHHLLRIVAAAVADHQYSKSVKLRAARC